jgi:hypothetical protein
MPTDDDLQDLPPLTPTQIEGEIEALKQAVAAILAHLPPQQAASVAIHLAAAYENARTVQAKAPDERVRQIIEVAADGIARFGRLAERRSQERDDSPSH